MSQPTAVRVARSLAAALVVLALAPWLAAQEQKPAAPAAPAGVTIYTRDNAPPAPGLEDLPLQETVTRDGVTWTFDKPARVGRFVNGDFYVVGQVTVVKIDPPPLWGEEVKDINDYEKEKKRTTAELIRNGSLLNPEPNLALTNFDSRSRNFTPKLRIRPPIAMQPGDVLVSTISEEKGHSVSGGTSPVGSASLLTCLREPVSADAFRPSYGDRGQTIYLARNLRRDLLLKLPVPPKPPDHKRLARDLATPWLEISYYGIGATRYQRPYGRALCQAGVETTLSLLLDYPPEEKEPLLLGYVQYAIDVYGLIKNGHEGWIGDGGWGAGRKWPIVFAGLMLDEPDMQAVSRKFPKAVLAEDHQVYYDDCWTGARVCFAFDNKNGRRGVDAWGAYEHWHPSRWDSMHGQYYRCDMTGSTWVGQALMIHLLRAEKAWDGEVFLDYCDRWMYEPDPGFGTWGKQGEGYRVGGAWTWFNPLWDAYRMNPPTPAGKEVKPYPNTGWQRVPPKDSDSVPVEIGKNRELRVKGRPFLPLMMFAETPARIALAKELGLNTIAEGNFLSAELEHASNNKAFMDELARNGLYGIFGADMRVAGHPALLGWIQPDEPDKVLGKPPKEWRRYFPGFEAMLFTTDEKVEKVIPPQTLVATGYEWMKKVGRTRPVFLALGAPFMKGEGALDAALKEKEYPEYLKYCDVAGCAVYPVTAGHAGGNPAAVARAVAELRRMAGPGKPLFAWIEAGANVGNVIRNAQDIRAAQKAKQSGEAPAPPTLPPPTPAQTRAETWMALIGGATAVGYRGFEGFAEPKLHPDMAAELKRLNGQITRLAPALLADPARVKVEMTMKGGAGCHVRATDFEGAAWVFAQSLDPGLAGAGAPGEATLRVPGLKAGDKVEVIDENRTLTAQDGQFVDDFAPLAVHVYRLKP